ncbi:MAG: hypothetical protein ACQEVD_10460 [Actinomycetota bacterium]
MRLPDIPLRHHRTVRTAAALGTGALALVRRRDVSAERQTGLRAGTALANAGLTWLTGSRAFLGKVGGSSGIDEFLGAFSTRGSGPVRYASSPAHISDFGVLDGDAAADTWWDEQASVTSPAFLNAVTAAAAGAASWALWPLTERLAEAIDAKLPTGVGRGLNAVVNGGLVAVTAVLIDKVEKWADDVEDFDYAPVEIELPTRIRESVNLLLSQPHPVAQATAEAVSEQLDTARFFVWVTYPRAEYPGNEPIILDPDRLAEIIRNEDIESIHVYPAASSPRVVPATQTYPVVGIRHSADQDGGETAERELSLSIVNGYLDAISFSSPDSDFRVSEDLAEDSVPGTLHPEGLEQESDYAGYSSIFEILDEDEQMTVLATWPAPDQLTFRADGS